MGRLIKPSKIQRSPSQLGKTRKFASKEYTLKGYFEIQNRKAAQEAARFFYPRHSFRLVPSRKDGRIIHNIYLRPK